MKNKISLVLCIFLSWNAFSQNLISAEAVSSKTKIELVNEFNLPAGLVQNGTELYKVLYKTTNIQGLQDTASGLIAIPDFVGEYPLLCYQHGTANSRNEVPSVINPSTGLPDGDFLSVIFSSFGYVVAAADYLGMGESKGFHPYLHLETQASAAIDLLFATQEFMETKNSSLNEQLFISGYSQGGHAALSAHQKIQDNFSNDFTVTASAPLSGPYSVSKVMVDLILQDEEYFTPAYIPQTLLSYNLVYNLFEETNEYFKQPYSATIDSFFLEKIDLQTLNSILINQLISETGGSFPKAMLQDSILAAADDLDHPLKLALLDNDNTNWIPEAPTRLYYCTADDQVPYKNSLFADSIFQVNGAFDLTSFDVDSGADHGECITPAVTAALFFFLQYQEFSVGTSELGSLAEGLQVYPNPTSGRITIKWAGQIGKLELYNSIGFRIFQTPIDNHETRSLNLFDLDPGLYFLYADDGERREMKKLLIE